MQLKGAIPACILPFQEDADLRIDEAAYREHLDGLVAVRGIGAVTCNGHAAEVASLNDEERRRAVAIAVETVAGRVPVVSGIFADDHRDAIRLGRDAQQAGADALLVMPPNSLACDADPQAAYRHFARLAAAVPLPLVVFVYPKSTGFQYDTSLLARICEIDSVVAVKEWSLDIGVSERNYETVKAAGHPVSFLTSFSPNLLPVLACGADGILSGHGSVIADLHVRLLDAVSRADLDDARATYARIQHLTKVVYRDPMPNMYARMKEQLIMLGHRLSPAVRPPLVPVTAEERGDLERSLRAADLLPQVV